VIERIAIISSASNHLPWSDAYLSAFLFGPRPTAPNQRKSIMEERQSQSRSAATGGINDGPYSAAGKSGSSIAESAARGKEAVSNAASEAMDSAAADWQSLRNDLNGVKDTVAKFMTQAGTEAARTARDVTSNVAGQVTTAATNMAGSSAEMASAANEQAKAFASEVETVIRRNPIGAMAGAVLVGILIGLVGRRS
jgi:ElaB/YqjD/DUF883 family membrane-anchored ribosome-binding protein